MKVSAAEADATWDAQLVQFPDHTLFQSVRWGRYKIFRGWSPCYFRAETPDGVTVAMLQALVRTYALRTVVGWCPGGPTGTLEGCSREGVEQLASLLCARSVYLRCGFARVRTGEDDAFLQANGWVRSLRPVSAPMSAVWDLTPGEEQLVADLNRSWRNSLRQSQAANPEIERLMPPPVEELAQLCGAMHESKGRAAAAPEAEVAALFTALGDDAVVYGCRNQAGRLIAFRACAIQGRRAWDLLAATSPEGRTSEASFAVFWALILHCRRSGVTHYDLAGMDPATAPGVAHFKRRTGAQEVEWLGDWEWSSSRLLRRVVNVYAGNRPAAALP